MINNEKVIGIISECNPFHEGHKRLIKEAKTKYHAKYIVSVMSGNFVERGEPAIYDKYKRTSTLLKNGVDLVIEIPVEYVLSSAKYFARCSIYILHKLGFVDNIIFGSNINNIGKLTELSEININSFTFDDYIKKGFSYPKIISMIYGISLKPNDILGVEYIRAIKELKSEIIPICIKRKKDLKTASQIRKNMIKNIDLNSFSDILTYKIFNYKNKQNSFDNFSCGNLELSNALLNTSNLNISFVNRAKLLNTKNRTLANIKRFLLNIILDIKKENLSKTKFGYGIKYIRILGFRKRNESILKKIKFPFLMSYANSSYNSFCKKYNMNKEILLKNKTLATNVYASDMYYLMENKNTIKNEASAKVIIY